jgi:hypothetical protein
VSTREIKLKDSYHWQKLVVAAKFCTFLQEMLRIETIIRKGVSIEETFCFDRIN